jgi:hypothetical protein
MGSIFKGTEKKVTTTNEGSQAQSSQLNPFAALGPGFESASGQLNQAIQAGPFQGQFIGDQSQFTQNALQGLQQQAFNNPLQQQQLGNIQSSLNFANPNLQGLQQQAGGGLLSPFIRDQFNAAADPLREQFNRATAGQASQFSNLGRLRGGGVNIGETFGRQQDALARGLGTLGAQISGNAFENQANRQFQAQQALAQQGNQQEQLRQQALGGSLNFGSQQGQNLQALLQGGNVQDIRNQAEVDAQRQQFAEPFNFANQSFNALTQPGATFGQQTGTGTQTGSSTKPVFGPSLASQIGGAGLGIAGLALAPVTAGGSTAGASFAKSLLG